MNKSGGALGNVKARRRNGGHHNEKTKGKGKKGLHKAEDDGRSNKYSSRISSSDARSAALSERRSSTFGESGPEGRMGWGATLKSVSPS